MSSEADANEEQALRAAVLRGDEAAWTVLHDRHAGLVLAVLRRDLADPALVEDAAQETWLVAVRRIRDFDPGRGRFGAWVAGIAARCAKAALRRSPVDAEEGAPGGRVERSRPEEAADRVALALSALPEDYRAVLDAKYRERATLREIAQRTGRTPKAVESLLARARAAFRRVWDADEEKP